MVSPGKDRPRLLFVAALAVFLVFTAVCLKASSVVPISHASPVVKIWADPDPASSKTVKIIPIVFFPLLVFVILALAMAERRAWAFFTDRVFSFKAYIFPPVWLRPPPTL